MIEEKMIELIESLDRIMNTWKHLTLRRTLLIVFTLLLLIQTIITTIYWMIYRDINNTWLGVLGLEYGVWGTMISWYFSARNKEREDENKYRKDISNIEN